MATRKIAPALAAAGFEVGRREVIPMFNPEYHPNAFSYHLLPLMGAFALARARRQDEGERMKEMDEDKDIENLARIARHESTSNRGNTPRFEDPAHESRRDAASPPNGSRRISACARSASRSHHPA